MLAPDDVHEVVPDVPLLGDLLPVALHGRHSRGYVERQLQLVVRVVYQLPPIGKILVVESPRKALVRA